MSARFQWPVTDEVIEIEPTVNFDGLLLSFELRVTNHHNGLEPSLDSVYLGAIRRL